MGVRGRGTAVPHRRRRTARPGSARSGASREARPIRIAPPRSGAPLRVSERPTLGDVGGTPSRPADVGEPVRLRPPDRTAWQTVAVALLAAFGPVALTLGYITSAGRLGHLVVGAAVLALGCVALAYRFSTVGLVVSEQGVTEHRLIGRPRTTPAVHIGSALVLPLLDDRTLRTHLQLFLLDEQNRTRLRMRGRFWSDDQISFVAAHFGVPVVRQVAAVSLNELRQSRRRQLSVAERHPAVAVVLTAIAVIELAFAVVAASLALLG